MFQKLKQATSFKNLIKHKVKAILRTTFNFQNCMSFPYACKEVLSRVKVDEAC